MNTRSLAFSLTFLLSLMIPLVAWPVWSVDHPGTQEPFEEIGGDEPISADGQSDAPESTSLRVTSLPAFGGAPTEVNSSTVVDSEGGWGGSFQPIDQEWDYEGTYLLNLYNGNPGTLIIDHGLFRVTDS